MNQAQKKLILGKKPITILVVLFLLTAALILYSNVRGLNVFTFTVPLGIAVITLGGASGIYRGKLFGGRKNFVGKIMIYFSIVLLLHSVAWLFWLGVATTGGMSMVLGPVISDILTVPVIAGQLVAVYVLLTSARDLFIEAYRKMLPVVILGSLGLSIFLLMVFLSLFTTNLHAVIWLILISASLSLQLVSALLIAILLGKWYAAGGLNTVAFSSIIYTIALPFSFIASAGAGVAIEYVLLLELIATVFPFYFMGIGFSSVNPRKAPIGKK